jgi:hypothetical protein
MQMQALYRLTVSRQWLNTSRQITRQLPSIQSLTWILASSQSWEQWQLLSTRSSTGSTACVEPDTDVEAAVAAALAQAGRAPGLAEIQLVSRQALGSGSCANQVCMPCHTIC